MNRLEKIIEIRHTLKEGFPTIGSWMQIANSSIAEVMGRAGYEWVAVDMEHGAISLQLLPDLFRALELGGTLPLARVAEGTAKDCKQALDAGAGGVIIPMIETAEQLERCISVSKWPPNGIRGVGFSRANLYGANFETYKEEANNPLIIAQIEHINAVENLEKILSVKGLDGIMIGPYDLSASMGITARFEEPLFFSTLDRISKLCKKIKIPLGIHIVYPDKEDLKSKIDHGYQFIAYSMDSVFLRTSANFNLMDIQR